MLYLGNFEKGEKRVFVQQIQLVDRAGGNREYHATLQGPMSVWGLVCSCSLIGWMKTLGMLDFGRSCTVTVGFRGKLLR
jgi:hypothetical protein